MTGKDVEVDLDGMRHLATSLWQAVDHAHPGRLEDGDGCGSRDAAEAVQEFGSWYTSFLAGASETVTELAGAVVAAADEYAAREEAVVALMQPSFRVDWSVS